MQTAVYRHCYYYDCANSSIGWKHLTSAYQMNKRAHNNNNEKKENSSSCMPSCVCASVCTGAVITKRWCYSIAFDDSSCICVLFVVFGCLFVFAHTYRPKTWNQLTELVRINNNISIRIKHLADLNTLTSTGREKKRKERNNDKHWLQQRRRRQRRRRSIDQSIEQRLFHRSQSNERGRSFNKNIRWWYKTRMMMVCTIQIYVAHIMSTIWNISRGKNNKELNDSQEKRCVLSLHVISKLIWFHLPGIDWFCFVFEVFSPFSPLIRSVKCTISFDISMTQIGLNPYCNLHAVI